MASQHQSSNNTDDSPLPEGSSDMVTNKGVIASVARRCWTEREEAILMSAIKELAATGWKLNNGFRSGYLTRALEALKREFPKTDIILDRSGVGFNADGEYKIDIDDEQWAQVVQKDSNAKYMRNKSWPMLSDWKEIFGKDRAEGVKGMDTGEAVQKIYGSNVVVGESSAKSSPITLEELFPDEIFPSGVLPEMVDESTSAPTPVRVTPRVQNKVPKKRKAEDKMNNVLALMNRIHEDTNERLKDTSTRIELDVLSIDELKMATNTREQSVSIFEATPTMLDPDLARAMFEKEPPCLPVNQKMHDILLRSGTDVELPKVIRNFYGSLDI
ncbi:hypothetical protein SASPL_121162 [Salvia splendens]|uniref:Myb/SANT-like domain-containing protein n=1 Tax=Salvia splendens TaxID=180675 RepID=A0A8X8XVK3_SALSN|nr:hypothetical protein SASPL_121162 [Salvia splendens]